MHKKQRGHGERSKKKGTLDREHWNCCGRGERVSTPRTPPFSPSAHEDSDPSIKAILLKIDRESGHAYIIEDLDEQTLVVKESKISEFKTQLDTILRKTSMQERLIESDDDDDDDNESMG
jgi:TFIIH basal transcription factor complex TTD-A subunit